MHVFPVLKILPHTCNINYVNMQPVAYVNMPQNYVDMQHSYIGMRDNYLTCGLT